mgnify:CR=1 FL=1
MQEPWPLQLSGQWAVFSSNNAGDRGWGALGRREGLLALSEGVAKTDTTDRRTVVVWSILLGVGVKGGWPVGDRWMMVKDDKGG